MQIKRQVIDFLALIMHITATHGLIIIPVVAKNSLKLDN